MAQNENYSQVDLRVGTEEQFNAKVGTLPAGTLFGVTDSTVSKADLSTDLKNEINGKINKPVNPTSDSAVVINSSGTVSTKPLSDIAGKSEVYIGSTTPTNEDEILWIDPDGTSGGGGSSGGGKVYQHRINFRDGNDKISFYIISSVPTPFTYSSIDMGGDFIVMQYITNFYTSDASKYGIGIIRSLTNGYCSYSGVLFSTSSAEIPAETFSRTGASISNSFNDTVMEL